MPKPLIILLSLLATIAATAQTYDHDDPKMKQITVQEIGSGALTPDFYYTLFHNNYRKTAADKNKLKYRTTVGVSSYIQVADARQLDSALVKRAAVEALNVADRTGGTLDLAWSVEGTKITTMLETFEKNIRRIPQAGGTPAEQRHWQEHASVIKTAITATQDAYIPNSQRKRQYLAIYKDLTEKNEALVTYISRLAATHKVHTMLHTNYHKPDTKSSIAAQAIGRWRRVGWGTSNHLEQ